MQIEQIQQQTMRQRAIERLYTLARKDVEWGESLLWLKAFHRASLLAWPPVELSGLPFYAPLVSQTNALIWFVFALLSVSAWYSGIGRLRAAVLVAAVALWGFSAAVTFVYADNKLLSGDAVIMTVFAAGVLLRLGARWPASE